VTTCSAVTGGTRFQTGYSSILPMHNYYMLGNDRRNKVLHLVFMHITKVMTMCSAMTGWTTFHAEYLRILPKYSSYVLSYDRRNEVSHWGLTKSQWLCAQQWQNEQCFTLGIQHLTKVQWLCAQQWQNEQSFTLGIQHFTKVQWLCAQQWQEEQGSTQGMQATNQDTVTMCSAMAGGARFHTGYAGN